MQEVACERSCERKQVVEAPISTDMAPNWVEAGKERDSHERVRAILGGQRSRPYEREADMHPALPMPPP